MAKNATPSGQPGIPRVAMKAPSEEIAAVATATEAEHHTQAMLNAWRALAGLLLVAAAAHGLPPVSLSWGETSGTCAFRQTGGCSGQKGPPQPSGDRPCGATVPCNPGACPSGYCDCGDGARTHPVACVPGAHKAFRCADVCGSAQPKRPVLVFSNGYVQAAVDTAAGKVLQLTGDFSGAGQFGVNANALATPWQLESEDTSGNVSSASAKPQLAVLSNNSALARIRLSGVAAATATEDWVISLEIGARAIQVNTSGSWARQPGIRSVRHAASFAATSITAFFARGVVQMRGKPDSYFPSLDRLPSLYALGGGTAIEVLRTESGLRQQAVLRSAPAGGGGSGLQIELAGGVIGPLSQQDQWGSIGWNQAGPIGPNTTSSWATSVLLAPNDRNFPSLNMTTGGNLPMQDLEAIMTGMYGTGPGTLCTFDNGVVPGKRVAQVATTIARPDRGYGGTYNYFDPDNFIGLSALIYSGNPYLQDQARQVIERSGAFLLANGQLPHHFVKDKPTYTALSGALQTGPNTFWTKTALQYAKASGDGSWLKSYMPTLRNASNFCFGLIDLDEQLLKAPGSLMIDVFIRANYTSDSNAMMVGFLRDFAEAEQFVGNVTGANRLRQLADQVAAAMNAKLWAAKEDDAGGDHYVTQLNPDGSTRDFVDYDSNLIAVAHGVPDAGRAALVLKRVDSGRCASASGAGPQFVSEKYYGKSDTTSGNVGDSWCSMGRIAWFDSHARKRVGGSEALQAFNSYTLEPLKRDLIANTWMHERYGCDGKQQQNRTDAYFEYPATVAMLLREIRYGINLGLATVSIDPFGAGESFRFDIGNVKVGYSSSASAPSVEIDLPGNGNRTFTITGMPPDVNFQVTACGTLREQGATSDGAGVVTFEEDVSCVIKVTKRSL